MTYNPDFDIDLEFGLVYEEKLKNILQSGGGKIEVKTERDTWVDTGNIAIEVSYKGRPSGLAGTKADWWFHILTIRGDMISMLCFPVPKLKYIIRELFKKEEVKTVKGGDNNDSEILLVPINKLVTTSFFK